jgi:acylpyruvate hydrolase
MKLITFVAQEGPRAGALVSGDSQVVDLNRADSRLPADVLALLQGGRELLALASRIAAAPPADATFKLSDVQLKAPLCPGKIICIGQNYLEHAKESNASKPPYPIIFAKFSNAIIGPGETIVVPSAVQKPDYEGELAVVIGKKARNVPEDRALEYVAGYTVLNDVSARDWQNRVSQWVLGKTPDTFCPVGPALVTADEISDPQDLHVKTSIGGEELQNGYTGDMIFPIAVLIADMTRVMTLEPGDLIATGTPSGIGAARTPPRWLKEGDVVRIEIDRVGVLENPVACE